MQQGLPNAQILAEIVHGKELNIAQGDIFFLYMYMCMYIYMLIYIHMYMLIYIHMSMIMYMLMHMHLHTHVCAGGGAGGGCSIHRGGGFIKVDVHKVTAAEHASAPRTSQATAKKH